MRREEKLRELMVRYLEGSISPEDAERLNDAVEHDWAARREMAELMLQETLLARVGKEEFYDLDRPVRTRKPSHMTSRIMIAPPLPAAKRSIWPGAAVAAAVLFAVCLGFAVRGEPAARPETEFVLPTAAPPVPEPKAPVAAEPKATEPATPVKEKVAVPPAPVPKAPANAKTAKKPAVPEGPKNGPLTNPIAPEGVLTLPAAEKPPMPAPAPLPPAPKQPKPKEKK